MLLNISKKRLAHVISYIKAAINKLPLISTFVITLKKQNYFPGPEKLPNIYLQNVLNTVYICLYKSADLTFKDISICAALKLLLHKTN